MSKIEKIAIAGTCFAVGYVLGVRETQATLKYYGELSAKFEAIQKIRENSLLGKYRHLSEADRKLQQIQDYNFWRTVNNQKVYAALNLPDEEQEPVDGEG